MNKLQNLWEWVRGQYPDLTEEKCFHRVEGLIKKDTLPDFIGEVDEPSGEIEIKDFPRREFSIGMKVVITDSIRYYIENHGWSKEFIYDIGMRYTIRMRGGIHKENEIGKRIFRVHETMGGFPEDCLNIVTEE